MTEIPEHLIKRAEQARQAVSDAYGLVDQTVKDITGQNIPAHILARTASLRFPAAYEPPQEQQETNTGAEDTQAMLFSCCLYLLANDIELPAKVRPWFVEYNKEHV